MSGVLYNRGQQSRNSGTFRNELQECLGWIETMITEPPYDCGGEKFYVKGTLFLASVNRMRKACGMKELPPACDKCGSATERDCICDPMNGEVE